MNHFCVPNILRFSFPGTCHLLSDRQPHIKHHCGGGGVVSQVWLRNYHPGWYRKYNYISWWCTWWRRTSDDIYTSVCCVWSKQVYKKPFSKGEIFERISGLFFFFLDVLLKDLFISVGRGESYCRKNVDYCNGNGALDVKIVTGRFGGEHVRSICCRSQKTRLF